MDWSNMSKIDVFASNAPSAPSIFASRSPHLLSLAPSAHLPQTSLSFFWWLISSEIWTNIIVRVSSHAAHSSSVSPSFSCSLVVLLLSVSPTSPAPLFTPLVASSLINQIHVLIALLLVLHWISCSELRSFLSNQNRLQNNRAKLTAEGAKGANHRHTFEDRFGLNLFQSMQP